MRGKIKRSLLSRFGIYSAVLVGFVLLALLSVFGGIRRLDRAQKRFMDRIWAQEQVSGSLDQMETLFSDYRNSWDRGDLGRYRQACMELESWLGAYREYAEESQETLDSIRRLEGFCQYHLKLLGGAETEAELYQLSSYIGPAISLHQNAAREMGQRDLEYSRGAYQKEANRALGWMTAAALLSTAVLAAFGVWGLRAFFLVRRDMERVGSHLCGLASRNWEMPDLSLNDYVEFERLSSTLNLMKHQIQDYVIQTEKDSRLAVQLKEERLANERQRAELIAAQMSALRAQVNPHFLFNALNMIGSCALVDGPENVMKLVEATGRILRYSLYTREKLVLLDDEIEIVEQYLFLQKYRFGEGLHAEINNRLEGEELKIPPMTVQPVVENCFKHGLKGRKEFLVDIQVFMENGAAVVRVTDNGAGFQAEEAMKKGGIGLKNIEKRMELQYGEGHRYLEIQSRPGFTCVALKIPEREGKDDEAFDRGG